MWESTTDPGEALYWMVDDAARSLAWTWAQRTTSVSHDGPRPGAVAAGRSPMAHPGHRPRRPVGQQDADKDRAAEETRSDIRRSH